jgi:hypothetical protein
VVARADPDLVCRALDSLEFRSKKDEMLVLIPKYDAVKQLEKLLF